MKKYRFATGMALSLGLAIWGLPAVLLGDPMPPPPNPIVPLGLDEFVTQPGTFFDIPGIGPGGSSVQVNFLGVENAQGADTIVQRLDPINVPDVIGATDTVRTVMTLLDLKSTAPVTIGGVAYTVLVGLTPGVPSDGTLDFTRTNLEPTIPSGTFVSNLDVNFTLTFDLNGAAAPCPLPSCEDSLMLTGNGLWTDDLGQDWLIGVVKEKHPNGAMHIATVIPEPASLLLIGAGLLGGVVCRRLF